MNVLSDVTLAIFSSKFCLRLFLCWIVQLVLRRFRTLYLSLGFVDYGDSNANAVTFFFQNDF